MNTLARWFVLRRMIREWPRTLLTVAGVALGVGVFVSVRVANQSALGSFTRSVDAVTGRANLQVSSASGPFDERVFPLVRRVAGGAAACGPNSEKEDEHVLSKDSSTLHRRLINDSLCVR